MKIVCTEPLGIGEPLFENLKLHYMQLGHSFQYYPDRNEDSAEMARRIGDAEVAVVSNIKLPREVLEKCPNLRYLSIAFTGLDHIDLDYCRERGIDVQNAAGYSTTAVSELAVALMIDVMRQITATDGTIRQGKGRGAMLGRELRGKTVGVIGTGAIGTAVIRLLLAFGCHVVAYNRSVHDEVLSLGVEYIPLEKLLEMSDIVTLHVPATAETKGMIGTEQLKQMKPTAILVNTARGPVCDIAAVAEALNSGKIAGAAFDVYEKEPPLESSHPLLSAKNCLCTPHIAFATEESFAERATIVFNHVDEWLARAR